MDARRSLGCFVLLGFEAAACAGGPSTGYSVDGSTAGFDAAGTADAPESPDASQPPSADAAPRSEGGADGSALPDAAADGGGGDTSVATDGGPCMPIPGASYSSLPTVGAPTTNPPPPMHPDLNVKIRGWESTGGTLGFVTYSGPTDSLAPHFEGMFGGQVPPFVANDTVNGWDWTTNMPTGPITDWPVTMIALGTSPGDLLGAPPSGYDIGGGMTARVLYADPSSITLKYTGEDNVVTGYTIHVVGVCVEPSLMALYASDDAAGRTQLPALANTQPFGRAQGTSVLVAICDSGSFMDPRSQKDWW